MPHPPEVGFLARLISWLSGHARRAGQGIRSGDDLPPELRHAIWNTKVMGAALARQAFAQGLAGPHVTAPPDPVLVRLGGRLCRQEDIESPWLHHWCGRLGMAAFYHRKVWEECYVAQALWEAGMLTSGRRGLGFAVGRELLPAFLAGCGAEVLATDLAAADSRARMWYETGQHADAAAQLFHAHLVERAEFDARVAFRPVDMKAIPADLRRGEFDFLWSVCSLEHLGTLDAGFDFVRKAMDCLRPGGVAVHTTEYNMDQDRPTVGRGVTVLYQRRHIEALAARMEAEGHQMLPVDFSAGTGVLDLFVDLPPFPRAEGGDVLTETPHLRKALREHVATSVGFIIRKAR